MRDPQKDAELSFIQSILEDRQFTMKFFSEVESQVKGGENLGRPWEDTCHQRSD